MKKEEKKEKIEVEPVKLSDAKKAFRSLIEAYAKRNPTKYGMKKEALEASYKAIK